MTAVRPADLTIGARSLPLPVYFPSISSVKTALLPQDYLQLLSSLGGLNGQFLVSAFDLAGIDQSQSMQGALSSARQAGIVTTRTIERGATAYMAREVLDIVTLSERALASTQFDTRVAQPNRSAPAAPQR